MLKKILAVGLVFGLLFVGAYYFGVFPTRTGNILEVTVTEQGTGNTWGGIVPLDEGTAAQLAATAYTADVPALNPNGLYTIEMQLTATFDVDGQATSRVFGIMGNGHPAYRDDGYNRNFISDGGNVTANTETVYDHQQQAFAWYYDGNDWFPILGSIVDGSVFDMYINATGYNAEGAWSVGNTIATITISVGPTGEITITINNIDVTVSGATRARQPVATYTHETLPESIAEGVEISYGPEESPETRALWLTGFLYRQAITITNSGSELSNYVQRIDLNSTNGFVVAHAKADGDDIRFTDTTSTILESYWVEYWNVTIEEGGTHWVKFATIPAGSTNFYAYYGNVASIAFSNGTAVFNVFDEFTGTGYTNRDAQTTGLSGAGAMYEKAMTPIFTPNEDIFHEANGSLMGVSIGNTSGTADQMAYGTYFNSSYAAICGASSTTGNTWTRYTNNPIINHSTTVDDPDHLKATEPDWLTDCSDTYSKAIDPGGYQSSYNIYYSGLNATNWSINLAYDTVIDSAWTKYASNPVVNGSLYCWDYSGVRKPVVFRHHSETAYVYMLYAGSSDNNNSWDIGIVRSNDYITWTKVHNYSILNNSAFGWDNHSVIPLDIYTDHTNYYYMVYAGMNNDLDWRVGIAIHDIADDTFDNWVKWGGVICLGNTGNWDGEDCNYGSVNVQERGESDEYTRLFFTGKNSTFNTQMGYSVLRNTSWNHKGDAGSCFSLYDNGLRIDWNNTLLVRSNGVDAVKNVTAFVDFWPKDVSGYNNVSVVGRHSTDAFALRDGYQGQCNNVNSTLDCIQTSNGVETMLEEVDASAVISGIPQYLLYLTCWGDTQYAFLENMANNQSVDANGTDNEFSDAGHIGIQEKLPNSPVQYDWFRTLTATGSSVGTAFGNEGQYSAPPGGGGGGDDDDDDDDQIITEPDEPEEDWWDSLCCTNTIMMIGVCVGAGTLAIISRKTRDPRKRK